MPMSAASAYELDVQLTAANRRNKQSEASPEKLALGLTCNVVARFYETARELLKNPRIDLNSEIPMFMNAYGVPKLEKGARFIHYLADRKPSFFSLPNTKDSYRDLVEDVARRTDIDWSAKTSENRSAMDIAAERNNKIFQAALAKYAR